MYSLGVHPALVVRTQCLCRSARRDGLVSVDLNLLVLTLHRELGVGLCRFVRNKVSRKNSPSHLLRLVLVTVVVSSSVVCSLYACVESRLFRRRRLCSLHRILKICSVGCFNSVITDLQDSLCNQILLTIGYVCSYASTTEGKLVGGSEQFPV
jgi:hypothetical protein